MFQCQVQYDTNATSSIDDRLVYQILYKIHANINCPMQKKVQTDYKGSLKNNTRSES